MADWLHTTYDLQVVVAGGPEDQSLGNHIFKAYPEFVSDKTAKTSLVELVNLIGQASLLLTNDTSAVHIGAQLGVPTVCIFKGNHYGRFLPYPEEYFPNLSVCTPQELNGLSFEELTERYGVTYGEEIEKVEMGFVKSAAANLLG